MAPPVSSKDAIEIYTLAVAYLLDAESGKAAITKAKYVKRVAPGVFYFWDRARRGAIPSQNLPTGTCSFNKETKTWTVKLNTGEKLILVDKGNVWEVAEEEFEQLESRRSYK